MPRIRQQTGIDNTVGLDAGGPLPQISYAPTSQALWQDCTGKDESPIDIKTSSAKPGSMKLKTAFKAAKKAKIKHTGVDIAIFAGPEDFGKVTLDGRAFVAKEIHFHVPSEHVINGKRAEMEMQVTCWSGSDFVMASVLFNSGAPSDFFSELSVWREGKFRHFVPGSSAKVKGKVDLTKVPQLAKGAWFHYEGSTTLPPCVHPVKWFVAQKPATLSSKQLSTVKKTLKRMWPAWGGHGNYRDIQNSRAVKLFSVA